MARPGIPDFAENLGTQQGPSVLMVGFPILLGQASQVTGFGESNFTKGLQIPSFPGSKDLELLPECL